MTRINCIPVEELSDQHLFAEFRELPRIRHMHPRNTEPTISCEYVLGKGHVMFFLDKGLWLEKRHKELYDELVKRYQRSDKNFETVIPLLSLDHWEEKYMNDWQPNEKEIDINVERVLDRILNGKINHTWS